MRRVLVVDDSKFMRTVIGSALSTAGYDVETATNGSRAIEAVAAFDPDVVTMDVEMPQLGGIDAVERIMTTNPTPILMLSAHTEAGAEATLDALERGAVDFMHKLEPSSSQSRTIDDFTDDVVAKVDELATADISPVALARAAANSSSQLATAAGANTADGSAGTVTESTQPSGPESTPIYPARLSSEDDEHPDPVVNEDEYVANPTVVVGASTGGPKIVERLVTELPIDLGAKLIVVQHMPESFTGRFADRLDSLAEYDIAEAKNGFRLGAGEVAIAPGDSHVEVTGNAGGRITLRLNNGPRVHGVRPSIDVTMKTAARAVTDPLCGVVLTGMGRDGAAGIEAISTAGGYTIAQNEATSPVFGIPCKAIETGCVDEIAPADKIVDAIVDAFRTDGENDD